MKCKQVDIKDLFEQQFVHIKDFSCFNLGITIPSLKCTGYSQFSFKYNLPNLRYKNLF